MDHDHDDHDHDDDEVGLEINIDPRFDAMEALGLTLEDLQEALPAALDSYHERIEAESEPVSQAGLEELVLDIEGRAFRLGDLAEISILDHGA